MRVLLEENKVKEKDLRKKEVELQRGLLQLEHDRVEQSKKEVKLNSDLSELKKSRDSLNQRLSEVSHSEKILSSGLKNIEKEKQKYENKIEKLNSEIHSLKSEINLIKKNKKLLENSDENEERPARFRIRDSTKKVSENEVRPQNSTIHEYVLRALNNGFSKDHITKKLVTVGWEENQVEEIFKNIKS